MLNLIGFLLPGLIDLFNRKIKDSDIRYYVSILVCVIVGVVLAIVETNVFDGMVLQNVVELIAVKSMAMFGMAQISYKKAWENTSFRTNLKMNAKLL